jgi:hypothetical protein
MSVEAKACPFCGNTPRVLDPNDGYNPLAACNTTGCPMYDEFVALNSWNTRPIEDALREENMAQRARFEDQTSWAEDRKFDCH